MHTLAAIPPNATAVVDQGDAWADYVTTLADQLETANAEMVGTYDTMRDVLASLNVPLMQTVADATGVGYPTAWTKDLDQQFVDMNAMGQAVVGWLREAARGERAIFLEADRWALEQKDGDEFVVRIDPKTHLPFMVAPAPPGSVHGPDGALGTPAIAAAALPLWFIAGGVLVQAAIIGGAIYLLYKAIIVVREIALGIIDHETIKVQYECLDKHTADQSICTKTQAGIPKVIAAIHEGREHPAPPGTNPLTDTFKGAGDLATTLLWVGFGGALIYLGVQVVPPLLQDWKTSRRAAKG